MGRHRRGPRLGSIHVRPRLQIGGRDHPSSIHHSMPPQTGDETAGPQRSEPCRDRAGGRVFVPEPPHHAVPETSRDDPRRVSPAGAEAKARIALCRVAPARGPFCQSRPRRRQRLPRTQLGFHLIEETRHPERDILDYSVQEEASSETEAAWAARPSLSTRFVALAARLEEKPSAPLRLVDPDLEQARGRNVAVLVASAVRFPHACRQLKVVLAELCKHVQRRDEVGIVVRQPLQLADVAYGMQGRASDFPYPFGDGVRNGEDLVRLLVEQQMVVAKMRARDVPVEVLRLEVQGEEVRKQDVERPRDVPRRLRAERGWSVDSCCAALLRILAGHGIASGVGVTDTDAHRLTGAVFAASMITFATTSGCESIATWLDAMVVVFALMSLANFRSRSGLIMRSLLATMYQLGRVFHATLVTLAPKTVLLVVPCVAATSFCWARGRSGAKFSDTPLVVMVR